MFHSFLYVYQRLPNINPSRFPAVRSPQARSTARTRHSHRFHRSWLLHRRRSLGTTSRLHLGRGYQSPRGWLSRWVWGYPIFKRIHKYVCVFIYIVYCVYIYIYIIYIYYIHIYYVYIYMSVCAYYIDNDQHLCILYIIIIWTVIMITN